MIKNKAGRRFCSSIHLRNPFSFTLDFTPLFSSISTIGRAITRYVDHKSNCQSVSPSLSYSKLPPAAPSSCGKWSATIHASFILFSLPSSSSLFYSPPPSLSTNVVMKNKSTFPSSDTLLNYLIPFCIVAQSVSGSTWYIDTLGKCRENVYIRSLFPIFWKSEAFNCSRFKSVLVLSYIIFYYLLLLLLSYYKRNLL